MYSGIRNTFSLYQKLLAICGLPCLLMLCRSGLSIAGQGPVPSCTLDPIVVTAGRIPEHLSKTSQSVSIISREEIENLPVDNVADLLEHVSGVDVRQRGAHGSQADVAIRGGSFEQTLILVDGVNVSDSQTGHHNMDLPVNIADIERIEVIKGPGARAYGHNAMAGVVNIITQDVKQTSAGAYAKHGEYDYYDIGGYGAVKGGSASNRLSASRRYSSGYMEDEETDFDIKTWTYKGVVETGERKFQASLGYTDKDFGAYRFYSDTYPNQRERTDTLLALAGADLVIGAVEVGPKLFFRRHDDDYRIEIGDKWFRNEHRSDSSGMQVNSRLESELGETALGAEIAFEGLESTNLGDRDRERSGLFLEHRFHLSERAVAGAGASAVKYSDWGWEYWPGADLNVEVADGINWFASSAESFRIPTFTELYYFTPANQGNADLQPERAWTHETGIRRLGEGMSASCSLFLREAEDVIDWSRASSSDPWKARNIADTATEGLEVEIDFHPKAFFDQRVLSSVAFSYTYLESDWETRGLESKYILDHLRHQVHGSAMLEWLDGLTHAIKARYEERMVGESHIVVDTRLAYRRHQYEFFFEVTNLLNEDYVECGFTPMPGSWIMGGVKFDADFAK